MGLPAPLSDPWFEASFIFDIDDNGGGYYHGRKVLNGSQGLFLWCPCGYGKLEYMVPNGGRPHGVIVPFSNPLNAPPCPADFGPTSSANPKGPRPRWTASGTDISDLTCTPSIAVDTPNCWHGWITKGVVT